MTKKYDYLILNRGRDQLMAIQFSPAEKVDVEKFKNLYKNFIMNVPIDTMTTLLSRNISGGHGTEQNEILKAISSMIHPKQGCNDELFNVALDFLGEDGWQLTTCRQSEGYLEYIFVREKLTVGDKNQITNVEVRIPEPPHSER